MKRESVPSSEGGEPLVHVTGAPEDIWRLLKGLVAYRERVDVLTLMGVPTMHNHRELRGLIARLDGTIESVGEGDGQVSHRVEVDERQADVLQVMAKVMTHEALAAAYTAEALHPSCPPPGDTAAGEAQETPVEIWARIARQLRPPEPEQ